VNRPAYRRDQQNGHNGPAGGGVEEDGHDEEPIMSSPKHSPLQFGEPHSGHGDSFSKAFLQRSV